MADASRSHLRLNRVELGNQWLDDLAAEAARVWGRSLPPKSSATVDWVCQNVRLDGQNDIRSKGGRWPG